MSVIFRKTAYFLTTLLMLALFFTPRGSSDDFKYEAHGKRDPFVPLVGIGKASALRLEDARSISDVKLEGVASGPRGNLIAILNGQIVKEDERFGDIEVMKISKRNVTISISGKKYDVGLIEEGGR